MTCEDRRIDFKFSPPIIQTCIGLVDDKHKTVVREDGSLNYNYRPGAGGLEAAFIPSVNRISRYTIPANDNQNFDHRLVPAFSHRDKFLRRCQEYGDPALPFVMTVEEYEHTRIEWTAFAFRDEVSGLRADIVRWKLSVADDFGYAPSKVYLRSLGSMEGLPTIIETKGTTGFWTEDGFNLDGITHHHFIRGGDAREGAFAILLEGGISVEDVTLDWVRSAEKSMEDYWRSVKLFENRFEIPEPDVMAMLKSCARNLLQAREIKGEVPEYQVGPTVYRGLWVIDGHFMLEAVHMMGKRAEAYRGVDAVLKRVRDDGSIQILPDHTKETGIAVATLCRQCELMNDDDRLVSLWPIMCRALDYLKQKRREAIDLGESYKGIFPPAFMDGGIAGPFPDYSTVLWILVGLKYAAKAGTRLQLEGHREFEALYLSVWNELLGCIERDRRMTPDGHRYFPMNMNERSYDRAQSATWSLAHAITPGELFSPGDPVVKDFLGLLDSIDNTQGIPEETGWIHDQAIWAYSSMFYAQVWLYAGRPEKAVDYLYAFANHAAPSRVWREEQSLCNSHAAEMCGDMPHNWASAEFIRLVRHLLVLEKQGNLEIFPGLPDEWMPTKSACLQLAKTPTRFGNVSVLLECDDTNQYRCVLELEPGNKIPGLIIMHWHGSVLSIDSQVEKCSAGIWSISPISGQHIFTLYKSKG